MHIKPYRVLLIFFVVGLLVVSINYMIPETGLKISDNIEIKQLTYLNNLFRESSKKDSLLNLKTANPTNIAVNEQSEEIDTSKTILKIDPNSINERNNLYFSEAGRLSLNRFFENLNHIQGKTKPLHILHIGDSQLDGDRITRFLRSNFQKQYGGEGCGFISALDKTKQNFSIWIDSKGDWSQEWNYINLKRDTKSSFGLLGNIVNGKNSDNLSLHLYPARIGENNQNNFVIAKLYLTPNATNQIVTCKANGARFQTDTIKKGQDMVCITYELPYSPKDLEFRFSGNESPLIHGVLLEGQKGIQVDNIAFRGQLLTRYIHNDSSLIKSMVNDIDVGLIILQFGANLLPNEATDFTFYKRIMRRQISLLNKFLPKVPIIIIGVGDAAEMRDGLLQTRKSVEPIIKAQKEGALEMNAIFLNLYEAMGGSGTMVKWSSQEPKKAMSDYLHFNQKGGEEVANLIYESINNEYLLWLNSEKR